MKRKGGKNNNCIDKLVVKGLTDDPAGNKELVIIFPIVTRHDATVMETESDCIVIGSLLSIFFSTSTPSFNSVSATISSLSSPGMAM